MELKTDTILKWIDHLVDHLGIGSYKQLRYRKIGWLKPNQPPHPPQPPPQDEPQPEEAQPEVPHPPFD